jgi:hypothetical protein
MSQAPYIVCGWYTPSYADYAARLIASLDDLGEPHDFAAVDTDLGGGWERQTMRKPAMIWRAMELHRDKTIIFIDADCVALAPLAPLARTRADVAVHLMAGKRSRGYGRLFGRTTTMVLRQTPEARTMVVRWMELSRDAPHGQVDQHTLTEAIAQTPGLVIEHLSAFWCAMDKDGIECPAIAHAGAARDARKVPGWRRWLSSMRSAAA